MTTTRRRCRTLALLLLASVGARPLRAQASASDADVSAAVTATVQRLFDAMATHDTAAARALLVPGMRFVSLSRDAAAAAPGTQADSAFLRFLASRPDRFAERAWSPTVRVEGPLATWWAPYDFRVNGAWSHCGVDTATLVRDASGWRIASFAYTVQRRDCPPAPAEPGR